MIIIPHKMTYRLDLNNIRIFQPWVYSFTDYIKYVRAGLGEKDTNVNFPSDIETLEAC